jgi:hypothetical protein
MFSLFVVAYVLIHLSADGIDDVWRAFKKWKSGEDE